MITKSFAFKSLIALGAVAILSGSAVAGPRATGHVKAFDGRTGMAPVARGHVKVFDGARGQAVARTTALANPTTPTGFKTVPLYGRKTGGDKSQD